MKIKIFFITLVMFVIVFCSETRSQQCQDPSWIYLEEINTNAVDGQNYIFALGMNFQPQGGEPTTSAYKSAIKILKQHNISVRPDNAEVVGRKRNGQYGWVMLRSPVSSKVKIKHDHQFQPCQRPYWADGRHTVYEKNINGKVFIYSVSYTNFNQQDPKACIDIAQSIAYTQFKLYLKINDLDFNNIIRLKSYVIGNKLWSLYRLPKK